MKYYLGRFSGIPSPHIDTTLKKEKKSFSLRGELFKIYSFNFDIKHTAMFIIMLYIISLVFL